MAEELPPNWEAVQDDEGRTYWWNVATNETSWIKPQMVVASNSVAAGYLSSVRSDDTTTSKSHRTSGDPVLDAARGHAGVAGLTARFNSGCSTGSASTRSSTQEEMKSPPALEGRSSATSVTALKKLQEARDFLSKTEEEKRQPGATPPSAGAAAIKPKRELPHRPPKVDLYK